MTKMIDEHRINGSCSIQCSFNLHNQSDCFFDYLDHPLDETKAQECVRGLDGYFVWALLHYVDATHRVEFEPIASHKFSCNKKIYHYFYYSLF